MSMPLRLKLLALVPNLLYENEIQRWGSHPHTSPSGENRKIILARRNALMTFE
jgi:hypothetical protein